MYCQKQITFHPSSSDYFPIVLFISIGHRKVWTLSWDMLLVILSGLGEMFLSLSR